MLKIDGGKIRGLRESKGLTQLFLATSVEVTTDTISRWENKRYPTIKKENALRLAAALEVELDDILLAEEGKEDRTVDDEITAGPAEFEDLRDNDKGKKEKKFLFVPLFLLLAGLAAWLLWPTAPKINVRGERILPAHTPVGSPFPVVIRLDIGDPAAPVSLILKEIVAEKVQISRGSPDFSTLDRENGTIKWIKKIDQSRIFAYLAAIEPGYQGKNVWFSGAITLRRNGQQTKNVHGDEELAVASFHWADGNRDNRISDEEILLVYDEYSELKDLGLDIDLIEEMWLGGGYVFDQEGRKFVVKE